MNDSASLDLGSIAPSEHDFLVAVEVNNDGTATLFQRLPGKQVEALVVTFHPWLLVDGPGTADGLAGVCARVALKGAGELALRVHLADVAQYREAGRALRKGTGYGSTDPRASYRLFNDLQQQLLSLLPARLFRGMVFSDVRRLQLDIETLTTPGYDFPNADRDGDAICMIAMRDNTGWEQCLVVSDRQSEKVILEQMTALIRERDPDVIEGHNIFDFDLPYIEARCKRHRVKLAIGRDGSRASSRPSRFTAGERLSSYRRYEVYGRHIVDTLHMVQLYDVIHRELDSYGLKAVARHFGVAAPDRTYVAPETISTLFVEDPDRLTAYAMDDVRETAAISAILSPSYFYQAQLVPFSYQNCVTRGNAARIDALLISTYMTRDAALPKPMPGRPFRGGLTESQECGIFENVWHVDIRSLYPSIMVSGGIGPRRDSCGVFLPFLTVLRTFRLEAKDAAREATDKVDRDHYDALQSSFKILINSFYGYLGFQQGTFNDFDLAESITGTGREILSNMVAFLKKEGAKVIELDTDGIYFVPPGSVKDPKVMERAVQNILPEGIEVDLDSTYAAMFSYKSKNYALLHHDGEVSITGAALKSRGLEPFQRRYMEELITLLLKGRGEDARQLAETYETAIQNHKLALADFAKREVLANAPASYAEKLKSGEGRRSAAYELVLASGRDYRQGDQVAFYITGDKKSVTVAEQSKLLADAQPGERDENVAYYLEKLRKLQDKFAAFLPENPDGILPGF